MAMIVVKGGQDFLARLMWRRENTSGSTTLLLGLFRNNYTPTYDTAFPDLEEADFDGYEEMDIDPDGWSEPFTPEAQPERMYVKYTTTPVWVYEGAGDPQTIYGWFLVTQEGVLVLVERWSVPVVLETGQAITISPFQVGIKTLD